MIGFLGAGNMARAMARGWSSAGVSAGEMLFTDSGSGRAVEAAAEVGGEAVAGNRELAERADLLVVGCKPKDLEAAAAETGEARLVLSILGATSMGALRSAFPAAEVHRAMPNLAVEINRGLVCLADAGGSRVGWVRELLEALGEVVVLDDQRLDAATAVMGCSPAYVDALVGALADAGARNGLDRDLSEHLAVGATEGAASLLRRRGTGEVSRAVASPGGSTEAGLQALRRGGFEDLVGGAVEASLARMRGEA